MILVTGATGQLGTAVRALVPNALTPGRDTLDLADPAGLPAVIARLEPTAIINCAAYTAVDAAEDDEATATSINGAAVAVLAAAAATRRIPFVTFSTDYVFDGTNASPYLESSPTNPINAYGRSKLAGERAALAAYPAALVIRTSWVYSGTHRNFVTAIVARAATKPVNVVADQTGCPTFAPDLAAAALQAMRLGGSGLLHLTNDGATTWFELARASCAAAGIDPERVQPIRTEDYPTRAQRPRYSVLGSERHAAIGVEPLRSWRDTLAEAVGGPARNIAS